MGASPYLLQDDKTAVCRRWCCVGNGVSLGFPEANAQSGVRRADEVSPLRTDAKVEGHREVAISTSTSRQFPSDAELVHHSFSIASVRKGAAC